MNPEPALSVVVPFFNEEANVSGVLAELRKAVPEAEIIAVDDGSVDRTWAMIQAAEGVRGFRLTQNRGQSAAMYLGLHQARGRLVGLMDGDGQNDPADFPRLVALLEDQTVDVVCGFRAHRRDTTSRRLASRFANAIRRSFLSDGVRDTGCSVKVMRREAVESLVPFNGMHRYLPAFFLQAGFKIAECPVNHRPRMAGTSKYSNWDRALRGIYDLIGVSWLLKRKVKFPKIEQS